MDVDWLALLDVGGSIGGDGSHVLSSDGTGGYLANPSELALQPPCLRLHMGWFLRVTCFGLVQTGCIFSIGGGTRFCHTANTGEESSNPSWLNHFPPFSACFFPPERGARRFNGTDVQISGQALRFLVRWAGRAVGWSGRAEVAIRAGSSEPGQTGPGPFGPLDAMGSSKRTPIDFGGPILRHTWCESPIRTGVPLRFLRVRCPFCDGCCCAEASCTQGWCTYLC